MYHTKEFVFIHIQAIYMFLIPPLLNKSITLKHLFLFFQWSTGDSDAHQRKGTIVLKQGLQNSFQDQFISTVSCFVFE